MGIVNRAFLLVFIGLLFSNLVFSQEGPIDSTTVERDGRQFHIYVVKPGNTLYSISRQYNISVKDIEKHNFNVNNGLSVGDSLYILAAKKDKELIQKKIEVNGNVIVHEVQKKQTLYAISKIYDVKVSDLHDANPNLKGGLKEGQFIKIPVAKFKKQEVLQVVEEEKKQRIHSVKSKETLYSISRLYGVPAELIVKANNGLEGGLKEGQDLIIPDIETELDYVLDTTIMKDSYNVAVILPFFLDLNDTLMSKLKMNEKERVLSKSVVAIQFYQGCLMAIDSLQKLGMNFNVSFYDSGKDTNIIDAMISNGDLAEVDLILGPFYQSQFTRVARYAREKKIHIVSPVPLSNKVLLGNPHASKVATSNNILFRNLARYVSSYYYTEKVIVVTKHFRANNLAHTFTKTYSQSLPPGGDTAIHKLVEIKWDNGSIDVIKAALSDSAFNIIMIPSNDQVYVTKLLSELNLLKEDYLFKVIGTENWLKYTNVDFEYFENLSVMIPVDAVVDYKSKATKQFIRTYYDRYEIFPENFSFLGFDVSFFFMKLLNEAGTRLEYELENKDERYYYRHFKFFKTGIESGFENSSLRILHYKEFELQELPYSQ